MEEIIINNCFDLLFSRIVLGQLFAVYFSQWLRKWSYDCHVTSLWQIVAGGSLDKVNDFLLFFFSTALRKCAFNENVPAWCYANYPCSQQKYIDIVFLSVSGLHLQDHTKCT